MPTSRSAWSVLAAATLVAAAAGCGGATSTSPAVGVAAATEVTGSVWIANERDDSLTVLDAATGAVTGTVTGLIAPHNVQASADGRTVWAVSGAGRVVALSSDGSLVRTAETDPHPAHVVGTPGDDVLVTSSDGQSLTVYDDDLTMHTRIPLAGAPHGVRTDGSGETAVVANTGGQSVDVVDLREGGSTARIPIGGAPVQTAVSHDGRWAYASVGDTAEIVKIDLRLMAVVARGSLPSAPAQVLLTAAGHLLTADQGSAQDPGRTVSVLDPDTLQVRDEIEVGAGPHGLTADPSGHTAWVTNTYDDTVSALDLRAGRVLYTSEVGSAPNGISYSPLAAPVGERPVSVDPGSGHDHTTESHDSDSHH